MVRSTESRERLLLANALLDHGYDGAWTDSRWPLASQHIVAQHSNNTQQGMPWLAAANNAK
jgi:hypothetical protein